MTEIIIQTGLDEAQRQPAAHLYYEAFRQKLHPIFRDEQRGLRVLAQSLQLSHAIVALHDNELVGIAGFEDSNGGLLDIQPQDMTEHFGFLGGWVRLFALMLFSRDKKDGILLMDGIVVSETMRGRGIGSQLLDAIIDYAQTQSYQQVRLDVVDTNPRARQLYERKGFQAIETHQYGWLKPIFGFSGSTTMHNNLRQIVT